jgi:hypothetical protein
MLFFLKKNLCLLFSALIFYCLAFGEEIGEYVICGTVVLPLMILSFRMLAQFCRRLKWTVCILILVSAFLDGMW